MKKQRISILSIIAFIISGLMFFGSFAMLFFTSIYLFPIWVTIGAFGYIIYIITWDSLSDKDNKEDI
jgi:ABC-type bacteriocin/lantibiotic exporter with double-glycine peptidase domain